MIKLSLETTRETSLNSNKLQKPKNGGFPNFTFFLNKNLLMTKFKLFLLLPAIALVACSKDSEEEFVESGIEENTESAQNEMLTEAANPQVPGSVSTVYYAGKEIPVEEYNGEYVFQGDIVLKRDMVSHEPQKLVYEKGETPPAEKSVGRTSKRWPNNTVYYSIDGNLSNKSRVHDAITHWEANTNLTFKERTSQSNYINFVSGSGCSSYVGMIGGAQNLTLSTSCTTGNTIHEIGHAIGLWHEQSRVDRDTYITVKTENIQSGREHNFYTYKQQGMDGDEFTSALDFSSIMLYSSYSFSRNGQPTMVKKDGSTFSGQRNGLSSGDKIGVNNMYPYSSGSTSATTEEVYVNGQYYTLLGLTIFRTRDNWYHYSKYGWKRIFESNGKWYYA